MSTIIPQAERTDTPYYESEEYVAHKKQVAKVTAIYNGSDAAKIYLNEFVQEDSKAFKFRQDNLTLMNFVKRTIISSRNKIFRKPIQFDGSITDQEKIDLTALVMQTIDYVMRDGYAYLVVDTPVRTADVRTRADEIAQGLKPYMFVVERKNVPNWTSYFIEGEEVFQHITINELYDEETGKYGTIKGEQQRVFVMEENKVQVEIWRKGEQQKDLTIDTDFTQIPVVRIGKEDIPFLYDMANINIAHMNRRSELNRYLRIAATPIPVIHGVEQETKLIIGVDQAVTFKRLDEGDFKWVEMNGSSTNLLQEDLKKMEADMFEIASTITSTDTANQVKTATQVQSENSEGESRLANIAEDTEQGFNKGLTLLSEMGGYNVQIGLNKDYDSNILTPEQINTTITLYREGLISLDTAWRILVEGEVLPSDFSGEAEKNNLITE